MECIASYRQLPRLYRTAMLSPLGMGVSYRTQTESGLAHCHMSGGGQVPTIFYAILSLGHHDHSAFWRYQLESRVDVLAGTVILLNVPQ